MLRCRQRPENADVGAKRARGFCLGSPECRPGVGAQVSRLPGGARDAFRGEDSAAIVDVPDEEKFEAKECPAYHCRATLPRDGTVGWSLSVSGVRKRKHRTERGNDRENGRDEERVEVDLPFPVLSEMARSWHIRLTKSSNVARILKG